MRPSKGQRRPLESLPHKPGQGSLNIGPGEARPQLLIPSLSPQRRHLRLRDYVQIINSVLFLVLGLVILFRMARIGLTPVAILIGGALVALGIYRLKFIWQFFERKE